MNKNKVAVISGGTSGIGLAAAKILSDEGWKTVLLGRDKKRGKQAIGRSRGGLTTKIIWLPHLTDRLSAFRSPEEQNTTRRKE